MALSLLLALGVSALAAAPPQSGERACLAGDCCWSGEASREQFCRCTRGPPQQLAVCAAVNCLAGPPPGACNAFMSPPKPGFMSPAAGGQQRGAGGGSGNCICPQVYIPVCAGGQTFPNECQVRQA
jgi:hypothetical protein